MADTLQARAAKGVDWTAVWDGLGEWLDGVERWEVEEALGEALASVPVREWGWEVLRCGLHDRWARASVVRYALGSCEEGAAYLRILCCQIESGATTPARAVEDLCGWLTRRGVEERVAFRASALVLGVKFG